MLLLTVSFTLNYITHDTSFPFHLFLFLLLYHPHFSPLQFHTGIALQLMCRGKVRQELFILSDIYDS